MSISALQSHLPLNWIITEVAIDFQKLFFFFFFWKQDVRIYISFVYNERSQYVDLTVYNDYFLSEYM